MTFDELFIFLDQWMVTFGTVINLFSIRLGDVVGTIGEIVLPPALLETTLFGLVFGAGFSIYIGYTIAKWIVDLIN